MMKETKILRTLAASAVLLSGTFALAQTATQTQPQTDASQTSQQATPTKQDATDSSTYATGKPLAQDSKEGFWGHVNPFARKKWVHRQVDPLKDRVNELDQLSAKNANDIRDVDSRATAGIRGANDAAALADSHAQAAGVRADHAYGIATAAGTRTDALQGTVSNLDQYQTVSSTAVPFAANRTVLGPQAKAKLDTVATSLADQKGYILEVQGYSRAGVATSQAMADSVARYLIAQHQVPVYRIYKSGLGSAKQAAADTTQTEKPLANGVRVVLLHNSLADLENTPTGAPQANSRADTSSSAAASGGDTARSQ